MATTQHRYHVVEEYWPFLRFKDNDKSGVKYFSADCSGIFGPGSHHFPVIETLLSIPFFLSTPFLG